ncbi:Ser/Thr protein kinase RdoA (MazF antagonist) [Kitasatospora sp. MAA4]|uniref:phosphotransferase enzyme family protein n=1 Tax=Kitasatospora sp. MAA4 TaxID=3035093 RepID=UPI0024771467|nr:phosphotransferase [Kitasatospora sp. MAA4]MDH6130924.1 Ser/Thr protein kinase RdoA (MazF antagonist) [Kitasatospora sp. MAA4]
MDDSAASVPLPDVVLRRLGLSGVVAVHPVTVGLTNRCWQVETGRRGHLFVKQSLGAEPEQIRRQHQAVRALHERGLPVAAPLATPDGRTLVEAAGGLFALYPWVEGRHLPGWVMSPGQARALGGQLARVHHELAQVLPSSTPETPAAADRNAALRAVDAFLPLAARKPDRDAFDRFVLACLPGRRALLEAARPPRPPSLPEPGAAGWIHGDLHTANVLWHGGRIAAVLDFDALTTRAYAHEVVRSVMLLFPSRDRRGLATTQAAAFVAGYRALSPLSDRQLADAAEFLWWQRACDLRHLERHYRRHDRTRDHLFAMDSLLLSWWSGHPEQVANVLVGA